MSIVIDLDANGAASVRGEAATRPTASPRTPANEGHGDVRKKVVPVVKAPESPTVSSWEGGSLDTIETWLASPRNDGAIVLRPADDPAALRETISQLSLIAVDFPKLNDGRGYSTANLLRQRYGYEGRLRAVGQITADQVFALARVGFNSFELRADQDADVAVAALHSFTVAYPSTSAGLGGGSVERDRELLGFLPGLGMRGNRRLGKACHLRAQRQVLLVFKQVGHVAIVRPSLRALNAPPLLWLAAQHLRVNL